MEIRTGDPIGIRCPQGRKRHVRHTTVSAWPASPDHSFVDRSRSAPPRCSPHLAVHTDHRPAALPRRSHHRFVPGASGADLPVDHGHPSTELVGVIGATSLTVWFLNGRRNPDGWLSANYRLEFWWCKRHVTNLGAFAGVSITMPDPPLTGGRSIMVARPQPHRRHRSLARARGRRPTRSLPSRASWVPAMDLVGDRTPNVRINRSTPSSKRSADRTTRRRNARQQHVCDLQNLCTPGVTGGTERLRSARRSRRQGERTRHAPARRRDTRLDARRPTLYCVGERRRRGQEFDQGDHRHDLPTRPSGHAVRHRDRPSQPTTKRSTPG